MRSSNLAVVKPTSTSNGIPAIGDLPEADQNNIRLLRKNMGKIIMKKLDNLGVKALNPLNLKYYTSLDLGAAILDEAKVTLSEAGNKYFLNYVGTTLSQYYSRNKVKRTSTRIGKTYGYYTHLPLDVPMATKEDRENGKEAVDAAAVNQANAVELMEQLIPSLTDDELHYMFYKVHTETERRRKEAQAKLEKFMNLNQHAIETIGAIAELGEELKTST